MSLKVYVHNLFDTQIHILPQNSCTVHVITNVILNLDGWSQKLFYKFNILEIYVISTLQWPMIHCAPWAASATRDPLCADSPYRANLPCGVRLITDLSTNIQNVFH